MTDTTLKTALQAVSAQVEAAMRADLDRRLAASDPLLREILDYALFGGGKRVRPFLCVQAARCCGRDDEGLYLLAAALEYLHTATLMHDDVVDHAPLRRGRETAATAIANDIKTNKRFIIRGSRNFELNRTAHLSTI